MVKYSFLQRLLLGGALLISLAGCVVGPGYSRGYGPSYGGYYATSPYYYGTGYPYYYGDAGYLGFGYGRYGGRFRHGYFRGGGPGWHGAGGFRGGMRAGGGRH